MKILSSALKLIRHKYPMVGLPIIITNPEKKILLGKRSDNHPFYPSLWGLPGGLLDENETMKDGVKREANEELGVYVEIIKRSENIYENLSNGQCPLHTIDIPYYCEIINGFPQPKDETSEVRWFNPSEIEGMELAYNHKQILKEEGLLKKILPYKK